MVDGKRVEITDEQATLDDFGELITDIDDIGGTCRLCARIAKTSNYYRCERCHMPVCLYCTYFIDGVPYCLRCSKKIRVRRFFNRIFGIREKHDGKIVIRPGS